MTSIACRRGCQAGAALLIMAVILIIGVSAFLLSALNAATRNENIAVRNRNAEMLAQAKAALIGYVVKEVLDLSEDVPGRLPCPESAGTAGTSSEGTAAANCAPTYASQKSIGRLPWRTLGIDKLVDAESEPLWYAVSPNWVLTATGSPLVNVGTTGQLSFDGTADIVAIIFAPGRAISTNPTAAQMAAGCAARNQVRGDRSHVASGGDPDYRDYLECQNATWPTADNTFGVAVTGNESNLAINDQAVVITAKELLNAIQGPIAERMQRTVAPLLSEFSDKWISGGKFMPYAVAFSPPEAAIALNAHCGTGGANEGLLPLAQDAAPCSSQWSGATISGDGIDSLGCSAASTTAPVICSFRYYRFTVLGQLTLGLTGSGNVTATGQASAPHAAASFRAPIAQSDIAVTAGAATIGGFSLVPKTTGDADLLFTATVSAPNICKDTLLGGVLCSTLSGLLVTNATVTLQYPQLGISSLAGSKLTAAAKNGLAGPFNLLSPAPPGSGPPTPADPHYWFVQNEWYRYTYYAVAPSASAAQTTGSHLVVSGFPTANGLTNDKRFVLAVMGPAVTGQTRSPTALPSQYVEGANAVTTSSPRAFAYQVYASPGNDRIATCPFDDGSVPCN